MMEKTLVGKTPLGEFQVTIPEESINKNRCYKYKESYHSYPKVPIYSRTYWFIRKLSSNPQLDDFL